VCYINKDQILPSTLCVSIAVSEYLNHPNRGQLTRLEIESDCLPELVVAKRTVIPRHIVFGCVLLELGYAGCWPRHVVFG
jgi:hypothetical protein